MKFHYTSGTSSSSWHSGTDGRTGQSPTNNGPTTIWVHVNIVYSQIGSQFRAEHSNFLFPHTCAEALACARDTLLVCLQPQRNIIDSFCFYRNGKSVSWPRKTRRANKFRPMKGRENRSFTSISPTLIENSNEPFNHSQWMAFTYIHNKHTAIVLSGSIH